MRNIKIILFTILLLAVFIFSGCNLIGTTDNEGSSETSSENIFVGTWLRTDADVTLTFDENMNYTYGEEEGTYEYDDSTLTLNSADGDTSTPGYTFADDNNTLELQFDGYKQTFKRQ